MSVYYYERDRNTGSSACHSKDKFAERGIDRFEVLQTSLPKQANQRHLEFIVQSSSRGQPQVFQVEIPLGASSLS